LVSPPILCGAGRRLRRVGSADLRLHSGYAPSWLVGRMICLAGSIFAVMVDEYGPRKVLARLSDPMFFQALSNVLGFDWDSSGSTTVTCHAVKQALMGADLGIKAAGGKGRYSHMAPTEIDGIGEAFHFSPEERARLRYSSRMAAKVDNSAVQDGYQLYHHMIFISRDGDWTVVQQGMNPDYKAARRYHWLSTDLRSFAEEPHQGIIGERVHERVLDMTADGSREARKISVELVREGVHRLKRLIAEAAGRQRLLTEWLPESMAEAKAEAKAEDEAEAWTWGRPISYRVGLEGINWRAVERAWRLEPQDYEELLAVPGVGPKTVRGLALISELIYGEPPSWRDPVKYTFAFGGKDGVPFPVERRAMDEAINLLEEAVSRAKLEGRQRYNLLRRLAEWRIRLESERRPRGAQDP
jgi:hypothetical protein